MPYVKFIAGHTGTGPIRGYLQRNGRALAVDYLNMDAPVLQGNLGELPVYGGFRLVRRNGSHAAGLRHGLRLGR